MNPLALKEKHRNEEHDFGGTNIPTSVKAQVPSERKSSPERVLLETQQAITINGTLIQYLCYSTKYTDAAETKVVW